MVSFCEKEDDLPVSMLKISTQEVGEKGIKLLQNILDGKIDQPHEIVIEPEFVKK